MSKNSERLWKCFEYATYGVTIILAAATCAIWTYLIIKYDC